MNWYMNQRNCQTNIFFHEKLVMKIRMKCSTESRDFTSDLGFNVLDVINLNNIQ